VTIDDAIRFIGQPPWLVVQDGAVMVDNYAGYTDEGYRAPVDGVYVVGDAAARLQTGDCLPVPASGRFLCEWVRS
jgi:thioredoxin reductase